MTKNCGTHLGIPDSTVSTDENLSCAEAQAVSAGFLEAGCDFSVEEVCEVEGYSCTRTLEEEAEEVVYECTSGDGGVVIEAPTV